MVGQMVIRRREELGLSQYELAKRSGVPQGHVSKIEGGEFTLPRRPTRDKIGGVLHLTEEDWFRAAGVLPVDAVAHAGVAESRPPQTYDDMAKLVREFAERQVAAQVRAVATNSVSIPIVNALSAHDAGNLDRQVNDTIEVPAWLVEGVGDPVLFVVSGDCLGADNLATGDLVIIDRSITEPYEGEIVAARANGEETLKHFHHLGDRVELRPSSPGFPTIVVREGEVTVIGVFAGVLRRGGRRGR